MMPASQASTDTESSYEEYLAQLDEIHRYKWIESQKVGEDIGFERALTEWSNLHREVWRKERNELRAKAR